MYGAVALRLRRDGVRKAYVLFTPESDSGSLLLSGTASTCAAKSENIGPL